MSTLNYILFNKMHVFVFFYNHIHLQHFLRSIRFINALSVFDTAGKTKKKKKIKEDRHYVPRTNAFEMQANSN